jgi:hypothetical protein
MEPAMPRDRARVIRRAAIVSLALHGLALWGLAASGRARPPRRPPAFAIDLAPPPPKAEKLAPEIEDLPAPAATAATDPGPPLPAEPAPPIPGIGLADAGVDAPPAIDAGRRHRDAGLDAAGPWDAGVEEPVADAGVADAVVGPGGAAGEGDAGGIAARDDGGLGDGGPLVATAGLDGGSGTVHADPAGDPNAKPSPGTASDLRRFFPPGHQVSVLVRLDRLRDTEWAPRVDAIFAPMPDYRALVGGTGVALTDTFETLGISTPEPADATATTLVVRARPTPPALRDLLDADDGPIAWSAVVGGALGRRAPSPRLFPGDHRVFLQWRLGWTALAQPLDLRGLLGPRSGPLDVDTPTATLPVWLQRVAALEAEAGEPTGPALMATASGIFPRTLPIPYGSGGDLPGPDRATVTLELVTDGFLVRGNVRFPDESAAATAADLILRLRLQILDDRVTAFALGQAGALNAIRNLTIERTGRRLSFATSISVSDARNFLTVVATMVDGYFASRRPPP